MKLHKRVPVVNTASCEINESVLDAIKKHDLTYGEVIKILSECQSKLATYLIRAERHPDDSDKKGCES